MTDNPGGGADQSAVSLCMGSNYVIDLSLARNRRPASFASSRAVLRRAVRLALLQARQRGAGCAHPAVDQRVAPMGAVQRVVNVRTADGGAQREDQPALTAPRADGFARLHRQE